MERMESGDEPDVGGSWLRSPITEHRGGILTTINRPTTLQLVVHTD